MTLWEEAAAEHPGLVADLAEVAHGVEVFREAFEAHEVHGPSYRALLQEEPRAPGGVFGHGLWFGLERAEPVPAVFVQPGLAPFEGLPIQQTPLSSRRLIGRRGFGWPKTTYAVGLPAPQRLADTRIGAVGRAAKPIASVRGRDIVITGAQRSWVRALIPELALGPLVGCWGEIALTADPIGEIRELVVRDDGAVVGHVVGGQRGFYTLFQDIEYALRVDAALLS